MTSREVHLKRGRRDDQNQARHGTHPRNPAQPLEFVLGWHDVAAAHCAPRVEEPAAVLAGPEIAARHCVEIAHRR